MQYDSHSQNTKSYKIRTLEDLGLKSTSKQTHDIDGFLQKLASQFPNSELKTDFIPPPTGTLGALIPETTLIIKLPKFAWGLFQTIAAGLWMSQHHINTLNMTVGGGFAFIDGVQRLKDSFYKLQEYKGEYCTYLATIEASDYGFLYHMITVERESIWVAHQGLQTKCTEIKCQYHEEGCTLQKQSFEQIIENLLAHKVLFQKHNKIGITL